MGLDKICILQPAQELIQLDPPLHSCICSFICVTHLKAPVWELLISFYQEVACLLGIFHTLMRLEMRLGLELRLRALSGSPCHGVKHYGHQGDYALLRTF